MCEREKRLLMEEIIMQYCSQITEVKKGLIRIAPDASAAFSCTRGFDYQFDFNLLHSTHTFESPISFEVPFAFKNKDGLYEVFACWLPLQKHFISPSKRTDLTTIHLFDKKPRQLELIAWHYVFYIHSRQHNHKVVLAQLAMALERCTVRDKIVSTTAKVATTSIVKKISSEGRQTLRTQLNRLDAKALFHSYRAKYDD